MFDIRLDRGHNESRAWTTGRISLGDTQEEFEAPLDYWTCSNYETHWCESLSRLRADSTSTALITAMRNPRESAFIVWWPTYRFGDEVRLQQQHLFLEDTVVPATLQALLDLVEPYSSVDGEGHQLSEWRVSMAEVNAFLATACERSQSDLPFGRA